jgi:hypothetical protein
MRSHRSRFRRWLDVIVTSFTLANLEIHCSLKCEFDQLWLRLKICTSYWRLPWQLSLLATWLQRLLTSCSFTCVSCQAADPTVSTGSSSKWANTIIDASPNFSTKSEWGKLDLHFYLSLHAVSKLYLQFEFARLRLRFWTLPQVSLPTIANGHGLAGCKLVSQPSFQQVIEVLNSWRQRRSCFSRKQHGIEKSMSASDHKRGPENTILLCSGQYTYTMLVHFLREPPKWYADWCKMFRWRRRPLTHDPTKAAL